MLMASAAAGQSRGGRHRYPPAYFTAGVLCLAAALSPWLPRDRSKPTVVTPEAV